MARLALSVEIEGAVHKLELPHAAVEQALQVLEQRGQGSLPHRDVERREAELARERAAARGLDIDDAVRHVLVVVEIVGQRELRELGQLGGDDLAGGPFPREQLRADLGELQVRLAGDDVVGQLHDGLGLGFVADLRPAEDDRDVRAARA